MEKTKAFHEMIDESCYWAWLATSTKDISIKLQKTLLFIYFEEVSFILQIVCEILLIKEYCNWICQKYCDLKLKDQGFSQTWGFCRNSNSNIDLSLKFIYRKSQFYISHWNSDRNASAKSFPRQMLNLPFYLDNVMAVILPRGTVNCSCLPWQLPWQPSAVTLAIS